jgi:hypothetical protein
MALALRKRRAKRARALSGVSTAKNSTPPIQGSLPTPGSDLSRAHDNSGAGWLNCRSCGGQNPRDNRFCSHCGKALDEDHTDLDSTQDGTQMARNPSQPEVDPGLSSEHEETGLVSRMQQDPPASQQSPPDSLVLGDTKESEHMREDPNRAESLDGSDRDEGGRPK